MTDRIDHYQRDEFRPVNPFSLGNILLAVALVVIFGVAIIDIWFSERPAPTNAGHQTAIPWSSHPKQ